MTFKQAKNEIRKFMQNHYTDERLAMLLAHAQSNRLLYKSCCCFIGVLTADHALSDESGYNALHYRIAKHLSGADEAEKAYNWLRKASPFEDFDKVRRRILIPMIRAEMKRRADSGERPQSFVDEKGEKVLEEK